MTPTPIALLQQAVDFGLKLGFESPETLTVEPARLCPSQFADVLNAHKTQLLALLSQPFRMVFCDVLGESVFFCKDDATKAALIEAGAEPWAIYTRAELRILVENNHAKPFLPDELCRLRDIRRTFRGRIARGTES